MVLLVVQLCALVLHGGHPELVYGDNCLFVGVTTGGIGGGGFGLVGSTAGQMNLLFLGVSGTRAGVNLIGSRGFVCGCLNDCCFFPGWLDRV